MRTDLYNTPSTSDRIGIWIEHGTVTEGETETVTKVDGATVDLNDGKIRPMFTRVEPSPKETTSGLASAVVAFRPRYELRWGLSKGYAEQTAFTYPPVRVALKIMHKISFLFHLHRRYMHSACVSTVSMSTGRMAGVDRQRGNDHGPNFTVISRSALSRLHLGRRLSQLTPALGPRSRGLFLSLL
ncbi:hypothetical protein EVAR_86091_1 [Eumeta japonica]|uniref:Uncharacterized protein n=1 Tax=Eumeta variegata TaxID=151549 RepID=A0A4C1V173_EUMVA|nr:hypothetical protein EVAR_86091_1 [Eumeta japonica]